MFCTRAFNDMDNFRSKHCHPYNFVWVHDCACREGVSHRENDATNAAFDTRVSSVPRANILVLLTNCPVVALSFSLQWVNDELASCTVRC